MRVFAVNLDKDSDRLSRFRAIMRGFDVPFQRWSATPGADLDYARFGKEPIRPGIYIKDFREWSRNEAACGISHITLLQHIVQERIPWAIVLEDDGALRQRIPLDVEDWDLPSDAEIVLLNDRASLGPIRKRGAQFSYADIAGGAGTEGYLVSLSGAGKLLRVLYPLRDPLDFQMYAHFESIYRLDTPPYYWSLPRNPDAGGTLLKAYRVVPGLVAHAGGISSIGNQRHPRAHYYCRVLLGLDFGSVGSDCSYYDANAGMSDLSTSPEIQVATSARPAKVIWRGVDISHFDEKTQFFDAVSSQPRDLMAILRDNGVNSVRLSLWVGSRTPFNTERALRLAEQAQHHDLGLCLVLHYSDTWADPRHQWKPADWETLPLSQLSVEVYRYTRGVVEAMCKQGTPPAIVQVGNEITNGMLWAKDTEHFAEGGRLSRSLKEGSPLPWDSQWYVFAELLRGAIRGVRHGMLPSGQATKVMVHIHKGAAPEAAIWWFKKAREHGIDFDAMGLSYYSLWHEGAKLAHLHQLAHLTRAFPDKEILLAETAYPYRPFWDKGRVHSEGSPPFTREGQKEYLMGALEAIRQLPNGAGLYWWGAAFINDTIEHCPDCFRAQALFDPSGTATPALAAFNGR